MSFTGQKIHGWRVATNVEGRRPIHGVGFVAHVDEPIVELVKGHNHIRGKAQEGTDPSIILDRCVTAALTEDLRVADEGGNFDVSIVLTDQLDRHKRAAKVREVAYAVQRVERRIANQLLVKAIRHRDMPPGRLLAGPSTQRGFISGTSKDPRVVGFREHSKG